MDYAFYLKEIASITPAQLAALQEYVAGARFAASPYFTLQADDGYTSVRKVISSPTFPTEPIDACVADAIAALPFVTPDRLWYYEFNQLAAGREFHEHTDVRNNNNNGNNVVLTHTVHIPITGNARYLWRRDRRMDFEEERMELGKVYLFNNYVWHKIINDGTESRTNLILFYRDGKWLAKERMYNHFGIPKGI